MSLDLKLNKDTHDLLITNGDLSLVEKSEQIAQNLKIRLQFFSGEWFLDTTKGLPFYSDILVKNPNIPDVDALIKAEILDTPGVLELLEFISSYTNASRTYSINFKVRVENNEDISIFQELNI